MYIRNRRGPSTDPCGTQESTDEYRDDLPITTLLFGICKLGSLISNAGYDSQGSTVAVCLPAVYGVQNQKPFSDPKKGTEFFTLFESYKPLMSSRQKCSCS